MDIQDKSGWISGATGFIFSGFEGCSQENAGMIINTAVGEG